MDQKDQTNQMPREMEVDDEINLIDIIYPIFKHRKFLIIFCFVVTAATALITWRMPKIYEATAVSLPEVKQADAGSELKAAFLEKFGVAGLGTSADTPAEIFESILKSEDLTRQAVKRSSFNFAMGLSSAHERNLIKKTAASVKVSRPKKEPTLSVSVQATDPHLAADLANTLFVELDIYNRNSDITSAQRLRRYIEKRLRTANLELEQAQHELRSFQEKNKAISISDQAKATIEVLSELEAKRVALEVEKETIDKFYKGSSNELEILKAQITAFQKNIDRLTFSSEDQVALAAQEGKVEFYIPLTRIPSLNFDESRLLLNVKAKTGVVTMLTNQLEQVKLDETKDIPTVNVIDWAESRDDPVKPKLLMNVILSGVVAFFAAVFLIYIGEYFRRMQENSEISPKLEEIKRCLAPKLGRPRSTE